MGRGLGQRQVIVLRALKALERERGPGWRTPAEVLGSLDRIVGVPPDVSPAEVHLDRADRAQLEHFRELVAAGHVSFRGAIEAAEARISARVAARAAREAERAPNLQRRKPRAGEDGNPSRVLAGLERRGLVERVAHCGPGSAVRLSTNDNIR